MRAQQSANSPGSVGAGMIRQDSTMLRREAVGARGLERLERFHPAVEPLAAMPSSRGQRTASSIAIFKMEPLADAWIRGVVVEILQRRFRRAVFPQQPHIEVPAVRRCLAMPRGSGPGSRQIVEAVPTNALRAPDQQLRTAPQIELLRLLGSKSRPIAPHRLTAG